ncbi:hypothetical protein GP5015_914 [gamma proteobacterium HTCC5015]|nr:hypothetical protein GP5015_914 [gamma proteobacterium HTCC5015]
MNMQLDFETLFNQALSDWPEELDLSVLEHADSDFSHYSVKGLGDVFYEIEGKFIDSELEVIFCELHMAIYILLRSTAKFLKGIKRSSIRSKMVKLIFEERLKRSCARSDLNWREADYKLVELYFSKNK